MPVAEEAESLSWLEDLAADQGDSVTNFLDEFTTDVDDIAGFELDFEAADEEATASLAAIIEPEISDEMLQELTDEEIARMQIEGTITPEQELAWFMGKADNMADALNEDPTPIISDVTDDLVVNEELPDWVQAQMPNDLSALEELESDSYPVLVDNIVLPPEPDDLGDWLDTDDSDLDLDLGELTLEDTE